jgi:hypothetical protein
VIRRFADARLLTTDHDGVIDADTVEVSHEALIREWDTLRSWVDEDREMLRTLKRVRDAMTVWATERADKNSRLLPPGRPLEEGRELLARDDALIDDLRPFIEQSIAADEARQATEQRRLDEENQLRLDEAEKLTKAAQSKRKATTAGLIASLVLMIVAGIFAWRSVELERVAEEKTEDAREFYSRVQRQQSIGLATLSRQKPSSGDAVTGMLLALEALPKSFHPPDRPLVAEAAGALIEAMVEQRERVVLRGHESSIQSAEFSRDATRVVTGSEDATARIWSAESGEEIARLPHKEGVIWATFSGDGTRVLTSARYDTVRIWDATSGALLQILGDEADRNTWAGQALFSPDGRRVVTAGHRDYRTRGWDAGTGEELFALGGHEEGVRRVAFSEDGEKIITASYDDTARVWDARKGEQLQVLRGHDSDVSVVAFSPDGTKAATGSPDRTKHIWNIGSGRELKQLPGHWIKGTDSNENVSFSSDGKWLATISTPLARLWNVADPKEQIAQPCRNEVYAAEVSPDSTLFLTACWEGALFLWDIDRCGLISACIRSTTCSEPK